MSKLLVAALGGLLLVAGCQHDQDDNMRNDNMRYDSMHHREMSTTNPTTQQSMTDDCPMCPGVQKANADGTCPQCHMKVKGT